MAQTRGKTGTQSGKRDTRNIKRKIRKLQKQLEGKGDSGVTTAYGEVEESYSPYGESIKGFKMKRGPKGQVQGDEYVKIRDPKVPEDAGFTTIDANRFGIDTRFSPKIGKTTTMDKKKKGMKAGGKVKAKKKTTRKFRGDGIARKGKTKGRFV